jgi:hypothetical protein
LSKQLALLAVLAAAAAASGCSSFSQAIGASKVTPDEFRVMTAAPLTLPPDYNLRPPRPGEARPQENAAASEAQTALFGETVGAQASQGERAFIASAGATTANDEIRDTIDFESQGVVRRNEGFVNSILSFGGSGAAAASTPLSPEQEAARLENEESIRRATGGGQVVIQRDRGGFKLPGT